MDILNDFIEIFGLNINEGDIVKDKQGLEYKLCHKHCYAIFCKVFICGHFRLSDVK